MMNIHHGRFDLLLVRFPIFKGYCGKFKRKPIVKLASQSNTN
jgi:hypothetical protein